MWVSISDYCLVRTPVDGSSFLFDSTSVTSNFETDHGSCRLSVRHGKREFSVLVAGLRIGEVVEIKLHGHHPAGFLSDFLSRIGEITIAVSVDLKNVT